MEKREEYYRKQEWEQENMGTHLCGFCSSDETDSHTDLCELRRKLDSWCGQRKGESFTDYDERRFDFLEDVYLLAVTATRLPDGS